MSGHVTTMSLSVSATILLVVFSNIGCLAMGKVPQNRSKAGAIVLRGTAVILATTQDGLVLAADSRFQVSDINSRDRVVATIDGFQKIYPAGPHTLAPAGVVVFAPHFIGALVDGYVKSGVAARPIEALGGFVRFAQATLSGNDRKIFRENTFFLAGYSGSEGQVCAYDGRPDYGNGEVQCAGAPTLITFNADDEELAKIRTTIHTVSAVRIGDLAAAAINRFGSRTENRLKVGGVPQVALLTPKAFRWLSGEPRQTWRTTSQFVDDYWAGRVPFTLVPPTTKTDIDTIVRATKR